jgi:hypothetical protein
LEGKKLVVERKERELWIVVPFLYLNLEEEKPRGHLPIYLELLVFPSVS